MLDFRQIASLEMTSPMTLANDIAMLVSETNSSEISSVVLVNVSSEVILVVIVIKLMSIWVYSGKLSLP